MLTDLSKSKRIMGRTIKLTLPNLIWALTDLAVEGMKEWLEVRDKYAKEISPIDSGDYIRSHRIVDPKVTGTRIVWGNENDSEHAFGVEYGFRRTPVNWHKWPPRTDGNKIYRGTGAKVMTRTGIDTIDEVQNLIVKKINEW